MNDFEKNQVAKLESTKPSQGSLGHEAFPGEAVELTELKEFVSQNVPEDLAQATAGEAVSQASKTQRRASQFTTEEMRARLLAARPTEDQMRREIRRKLNQELAELKSKARRFKHKVSSACAMNGIIAKMREIHEMFFQMAHATYEALRKLWLRVVYGIY